LPLDLRLVLRLVLPPALRLGVGLAI